MREIVAVNEAFTGVDTGTCWNAGINARRHRHAVTTKWGSQSKEDPFFGKACLASACWRMTFILNRNLKLMRFRYGVKLLVLDSTPIPNH